MFNDSEVKAPGRILNTRLKHLEIGNIIKFLSVIGLNDILYSTDILEPVKGHNDDIIVRSTEEAFRGRKGAGFLLNVP